ncbi:hypothetical protein BAE44_0021089 [Dichanthelium oligosanthes]|uniref:Ubiquitin-like protease family profile domain-containing protein n=1 Tax=Dichanthelium oligosanthes TaxID=888268 RepID=A0A1E5UYN5_9POAL|nr:hypothetical protein BAE44_0021089 [Dichanthelium oligosanthes]
MAFTPPKINIMKFIDHDIEDIPRSNLSFHMVHPFLNKKKVIISYPSFYVTLGHLAKSVKPARKLMSTVAEIGIFVIDGKKTKRAIKCIQPLRILVNTHTQFDLMETAEITLAFKRGTNHLDHQQMVMFPTVQMMKVNGEEIGHYFLIVLNMHDNRFEVLDSMRTLQDERLKTCCTTIIARIKILWATHYPETNKPIEDFELIDVGVPNQSNNHDCGFHMLMHTDVWDGRSTDVFEEKDIPTFTKSSHIGGLHTLTMEHMNGRPR